VCGWDFSETFGNYTQVKAPTVFAVGKPCGVLMLGGQGQGRPCEGCRVNSHRRGMPQGKERSVRHRAAAAFRELLLRSTIWILAGGALE
jgi:hypothetical protein